MRGTGGREISEMNVFDANLGVACSDSKNRVCFISLCFVNSCWNKWPALRTRSRVAMRV